MLFSVMFSSNSFADFNWIYMGTNVSGDKYYIDLFPLSTWYQFVFDDKSKFNYSSNENVISKKRCSRSINH